MPRCLECKEKFVVKYFLQKYCMAKDGCIKAYADNNTKKDWKAKKKAIKQRLKTHSDYIKELQTAFNSFIRKRDKCLPCITCGTERDIEYAAGHFYPTTYQYLRFNEDNVHKQCNKSCNMMKSGNLSEYRPALIKKIGVERVEVLDNTRHLDLKLSIPELIDLIDFYNKKVKLLK